MKFSMTRDKQKGDDERYRMFLGEREQAVAMHLWRLKARKLLTSCVVGRKITGVLPWIFVAVWVGGWLPPVIQEKLAADLKTGRPALGHVVGFALFLTV